MDRYGRALLDELRSYDWQFAPETVYLGGGTPSLMPPGLLRQVIREIPATRLFEDTMECAPGTVTAERVSLWRECGINRVSLGVQSFVERELRQVGRRHTAEIVANDLKLLRDSGIEEINLDLIAGLPGQSAISWDESLSWLERLRPPHASIYLFEVDEESRLGKEVISGGTRYGASSLPDDDLCAELYETAVERLREMGILRYEISNFAKRGHESRHNLKYWQLEPYVGFGLDAHSFDGQYRWSNADNLAEYFRQREGDRSVAAERSESNVSEEHFIIGLRMAKGIAPSREEWDRFAVPIEKWIDAGMLERVANRLVLSDRGYLISNEIFQEFLHA